MMRKLAVVLALASTALATPALARDDSWYVGVAGGAMIVEDINFDVNTTPRGATVDHDYGFDVDGTIGYDFGAFRVEAEVAYKRAFVDAYRSTVTTPWCSQLAMCWDEIRSVARSSIRPTSLMSGTLEQPTP